jgi:general secretion pathway protein F
MTEGPRQVEFAYKAVSQEGKVYEGTQDGESEESVAVKLQGQGLIPLVITPAGQGTGRQRTGTTPSIDRDTTGLRSGLWQRLASTSFQFRGRVKTKDLILFAEHLSIMLQSGITLNKSLALLTELTENKNFSQVVHEIHNQIREGSSLWQSLGHYPKIFPVVFVNMVKSGEAGGVLDVVLERVAAYLRSVQELKEYLLSAMIYPAILGLTALGSIAVMLTVVVPRFAEIFSGMGVTLPLTTQVMLSSGTFLQQNWWILMLLIAGGLIGLRAALRSPTGRHKWDKTKLKLPFVGQIFHKIEIARFSRTLGTLLHSGVSILAAMNIVRGVVMNSVLQEALEDVYKDLKQGRMLSVSLEKRKVFPALAVSMLSVGEEAGNLSEMLEKVGEMYDKDLKSAIKSFTSVFEPAVILVMGLIVGAMVVSMLMAIFSVNQIGM